MAIRPYNAIVGSMILTIALDANLRVRPRPPHAWIDPATGSVKAFWLTLYNTSHPQGDAMMMFGTHEATLQDVQRVDIHGTHFYDISYCHRDAPDQIRRGRVGAESIYAAPQPGDVVRITYLMGVVTSVERSV